MRETATGVQIDPYSHTLRFTGQGWYDEWDASSGVVWNASRVTRVVHVATCDMEDGYVLDADLDSRLGTRVCTMDHVQQSDYEADYAEIPLPEFEPEPMSVDGDGEPRGPIDASGAEGSGDDWSVVDGGSGNSDSDSVSEVEFGGAKAPDFD